MKCDTCDQEATVHEVVRKGGKTVERHLCEQCARKHGIAVQHMPINELIQKYVLQQQAGGGAPGAEVAPAVAAKTCPSCGLAYGEFRQSGLLGCTDCYASFAAALDPLLERAHEGGTRHVGKVPKRLAESASGGVGGRRPGAAPVDVLGGPNERTERLKVLNKQLDEAVRAEQYERAAAIRDEIRRLTELEGGKTPPPHPKPTARKGPDLPA